MNKFWIWFFILPLTISGCWGAKQNMDITQIDQQANSLREHLYAISGGEDVYKNENLDFSLLNQVKTIVNERCSNLINYYKDGKINEDIKNEGLDKSISLLYFVWMEQFDSAQANKKVDEINQIFEEQTDFTANQTIKDYLEKNGKIDSYNKLQDIFKNYPDLINKSILIDENNAKLDQMKTDASRLEGENNISEYNRVADEYNSLLDENNKLIEEYNTKLENYKYDDVYKTFINLINVGVIFPGQTEIPLEDFSNGDSDK
jgi:hypothetical protein